MKSQLFTKKNITMKRTKLFLLLAAWLMAMPLMITSCGDDDPFEDEEEEEQPTPDNPNPSNPDKPNPSTPDNPNPSNPDNPKTALFENPLSKSEYTIIFYGHGGGDLDASILSNIDDIFNGNKSSYDKVHATVMYKMSSKQALLEGIEAEDFEEDLDVDKYGHATFRFVVDQEIGFDAMIDDYFNEVAMPDRDIDIASPSTLTSYIQWAMEKAPAEKYILVISDHGGGYSPEDDLPMNSPSLSKGLVYDDGANHDHLTAEKIVKSVQDAGLRPEVIYLDACLMNTIEYQYELKDLANYLVLSTFSVPGPGGNYVTLVNELAKNSNIETALANFCKATVKDWDEFEDEESGMRYTYSDISVIRTANIDAFGNLWKDFTDQLIAAYQSGDKKAKAAIDRVTSKMMPMECAFPLYDMNYFAKKVIESIPSYFDETLAKDLENAYNDYITYRQASKDLEKFGYKIGTSILFGCNNHYTSFSWAEDEETGEQFLDGYVTYEADGRMLFFENDGTQYDQDNWNGTFNNTYKQLKFDQLTHWSDWLEINEQEADAYSASGLFYEITADGFEPVEYEDDDDYDDDDYDDDYDDDDYDDDDDYYDYK